MLKFTKMHGLGNDFMVLDLVRQTVELSKDKIHAWACRHTGIGFDQLLCVTPAPNALVDFGYRIFNADGEEVYQCGNGARCVARFIRDSGLSDKKTLTVATQMSTLTLECLDETQVRVNMGVPHIPAQQPTIALEGVGAPFILSIGNPHAIVWCDSIEVAPVATMGPLLSKHPVFPEGTNVGFATVVDQRTVQLRVYERGVGETLACGSGACAAVVAGHVLGQLADNVAVHQAGGVLNIMWQGPSHPLWMTGPAVTVFHGELCEV